LCLVAFRVVEFICGAGVEAFSGYDGGLLGRVGLRLVAFLIGGWGVGWVRGGVCRGREVGGGDGWVRRGGGWGCGGGVMRGCGLGGGFGGLRGCVCVDEGGVGWLGFMVCGVFVWGFGFWGLRVAWRLVCSVDGVWCLGGGGGGGGEGWAWLMFAEGWALVWGWWSGVVAGGAGVG
jgi:hypothetical protein